MSNIDYDDFTETERAKVDVERLAYDAREVVNRLCELRTDPVHAPYFAAEFGNLNAALLGLQLLCSMERVEQSKPKLVSVR